MLQDCFERTSWSLFSNPDVKAYSTIFCHTTTCTENLITNRCIRVLPNKNPWMTQVVQVLLKELNTLFRLGDRTQYCTDMQNLQKSIKLAKSAYKEKIEVHVLNRDSRQMCQGIQHITDYRRNHQTPPDNHIHFLEGLNTFVLLLS